ncbi:hypothetical protein [Aestuariibacter salexigens]|uniref:hypothetical protein n=1 Tax=Aestuariibacter salexigens TaxID=226010 RepID=UPI000417E602|nr:hypothetical protein [Aestuariibacter salexigens]
MDIRPVSDTLNNTIRTTSTASTAQANEVNAFGIGRANQPDVELSPQARILQQNEQIQQQRRESLEQRQSTDDDDADTSTNDYVRVSSSVGAAQRNNLSAEEATELYRSIEKML